MKSCTYSCIPLLSLIKLPAHIPLLHSSACLDSARDYTGVSGFANVAYNESIRGHIHTDTLALTNLIKGFHVCTGHAQYSALWREKWI